MISSPSEKETIMSYQMTIEDISNYKEYLCHEEHSAGTIEKYLRDIKAFFSWLTGREVSKENAAGWKEYLTGMSYVPVTINSMLSAVNGFLHFMGWEECRVKFLHIQRKMSREQAKELDRNEYMQLLHTAKVQGKERLRLLMETICSTGIRVSEVKYITVEAILSGRTDISLKGKIRTILLPQKLCRKLRKYAKKHGILKGQIFIAKNGNSLSRTQIWKEMKALCESAGVESSKVFPHNLRHLFASSFYNACKDIVRLADVLGHSCIETTRIYLVTTGAEHARQLERLRLIS